MLKLSVLDQSPIPQGQTAEEALRSSRQLAELADLLGFTRYWLSEHHNHPGLAGVAPEVLISHIAAHTEQLRIGSGGVLLSHYSPYKVAETFRVLEALYPGRIDLGIGRAPGGDDQVKQALGDRSGGAPDVFQNKIEALRHFLNNEEVGGEQLQGIRATPELEQAPPLWLLGSSKTSAQLAAKLGTSFSFAHFINSEDGPEVVEAYRKAFRPSTSQKAPSVSVCVYVVCAESDDAAYHEAMSLEYWLIQLSKGMKLGPPTYEEAKAYQPTSQELEIIRDNRKKMIVGSPKTVKEGLEYMADAYQADEIMILTNLHDQQARLNSYQLIADAFSLKPLKAPTIY